MNTVIKRMLAAGTIVAVKVGPFNHPGIVSDRWSSDGKPMVISNSRRRGCVAEESWSEFARGGRVAIRESRSGREGLAVVARARARLGQPWSLISFNCEHFVEYACGRPVRSAQLQYGAMAAMLGLVVLLVSKR